VLWINDIAIPLIIIVLLISLQIMNKKKTGY